MEPALYRVAWSDPLITAMVWMDVATQQSKTSPPPPPLAPMVMQFVNTDAAATEVYGGDDRDAVKLWELAPNWNHSCRVTGEEDTVAVERLRCALIRELHVVARRDEAVDQAVSEVWGHRLRSVDSASFALGKHFTWPCGWLSAMPSLRILTIVRVSYSSVPARLPVRARLPPPELPLFPDSSLHSNWLPPPMPLEFVESPLRIGDLSSISSSLTSLCLVCEVECLNTLVRLANLVSLKVKSRALHSGGIRDLWLCPRLEDVTFTECYRLADVSSLASSSSLTSITASRSVVNLCKFAPRLQRVETSFFTSSLVDELTKRPTVEARLHLRDTELEWRDDGTAMLHKVQRQLTALTLAVVLRGVTWDAFQRLTSLRLEPGDCPYSQGYVNPQVTSSIIAAMPSLTELRVMSWLAPLRIRGSLRACHALRTLQTCHAEHLRGEAQMPNLTSLHFEPLDLEPFTELEPLDVPQLLQGFPGLTSLTMTGPHFKLRELGGTLSTMPRLRELHFHNTRDNVDVDELCALLLALPLPSLSRVTLPERDARIDALEVALARRRLHHAWYLRD